MNKQKSYTKKGPGRRHNDGPSYRTKRSGEPYGNKLARKAIRGHITVRG